jgi:acyl-coenzyme A synthetase/AMP-(fatty) acid ligase
MSRRIADVSAKVARSSYPLPRMTDNVLSASLGQLTGLPGEVVPRRIELSDTELPKNGSGKILKRILRERFWVDQKRAVG